MPPHFPRQHAPQDSRERSQAVINKDTRHPFQKIRDAIVERSTTGGLLLGMAGACVFFPAWSNGIFFAGVLLFPVGIFASRYESLPFRLPSTSKQIDYNDPLPGRQKFPKARGIYYIGSATNGGHELWQSANDALTHRLVFGTTGAGKTENLLSSTWTFLCTGSGIIYIDPKAAPKLALQFARMARMLGRDDDLRYINFFTGGQEDADDFRLGNTTNPFTHGSAEGIAQLVTGLIPNNKGENALFSERAVALINTLMYGLVEYRDRGDIMLSVKELSKWLTLERCMQIANDENLSERSRNSMKTYLASLPGFDPDPETAVGDQPEEVGRQFGFAQAYFTRALLSLSDTYGQIFNVRFGEVDWLDVVLNRRILVVLLPAMEKPPAELQNLGKITLTALRNAMAAGLGSGIEGTVEDVLDTLPTASNTPTQCVVDEYAYVSTEGFAVTAAQARGLGFTVTFAGQDYAGMERASKEEAEQIFANTKTKHLMTLEDPQKTFEVFEKLGGEAYHTETAGYQINKEGVSATYFDQLSTNVHRRRRVDLRDLKEQIEGEAHIFFKGEIVRSQVFYAHVSLPPDAELRIHRHLVVYPPTLGRNSRADNPRVVLDTLSRLIAMEMPAGERDTNDEGDNPFDAVIAAVRNVEDGDIETITRAAMAAWQQMSDESGSSGGSHRVVIDTGDDEEDLEGPASLAEAIRGAQGDVVDDDETPGSAIDPMRSVILSHGQWAWSNSVDPMSQAMLGDAFPAAIAGIARFIHAGNGEAMPAQEQREASQTAEAIVRAIVYPVAPIPSPLDDDEASLAATLLDSIHAYPSS